MQCLRSKFKIIFAIAIVITLCCGSVITSLAYSTNWWLQTSDGVTHEGTGNEIDKRFFSQYSPSLYTFFVDNSDPAVFKGGYMYTFDVVLGILYPSESVSVPLQSCINDLVTNGFTTQWYINYVFDTHNIHVDYKDGSGQYHDFTLGIDGGEKTNQMYYVSSDECVVIYNETTYKGSKNESINVNTNGRLYIQQKVHLQFTTPDTIKELQIDWQLHNFGDWTSGNNEGFNGLFDVSALVGMDNSVAQAEVNILASLDNVSNQITALSSNISTLLQQMDYYFDMLTKGWANTPDIEFPDLGILPNMYHQLYYIADDTAFISTTVRSIKSTTANINSTTQIIQHLLDNRTNNFWKWLDEDFNLIHTDLITTNDYLNKIVDYIGVNDTNTQSKIEQIQTELGSSEDSIITLTSDMVHDESFTNVLGFLEDFDNVFLSESTLVGATYAFKDGLTFMSFIIPGLFGVISCFVFYKLLVKLWGMLYFDE